MLKVLLGAPSRRFLKKCETELHKRLMRKIRELAENPFPSDMKRVEGKKEKVFRVRVGDYRVQYVVFYEKNEVLISDIDKRPRAYD
ncbi:MAG TPA: type II toxin-antitoxin system RelE/ParE family toxin [Candidatus Nanoarchaeia archaeon]|nr:type II toxin-antitoxin system RelE/ParE family toxin [Candidatus Nanoarchaeia archaeon]